MHDLLRGPDACSIPRPGITYGLSLLLVLIPAPRVFLWVLQFFPLHKKQHSKFQFNWETVDRKSHLLDCPLLNHLSILIIIIIWLSLNIFCWPYYLAWNPLSEHYNSCLFSREYLHHSQDQNSILIPFPHPLL